MGKPLRVWRLNAKLARATWGDLSNVALRNLKNLTEKYGLSVAAGDLQFLEGRWYITHAGLLSVSERRRCSGIKTIVEKELSNPPSARWVFRATVFKTSHSRGFVGYGDADPSNVSPLVHGAEMRVAETRAVNRALRKAYGIGLCSVEELGWSPRTPEPASGHQNGSSVNRGNGHYPVQVRLRDRLCLLIRQYQLDPTLVKRYAADFCGTQELREASRDLVESFFTHFAEWAAKDRAGLVCKLNSYAQTQEVRP